MTSTIFYNCCSHNHWYLLAAEILFRKWYSRQFNLIVLMFEIISVINPTLSSVAATAEPLILPMTPPTIPKIEGVLSKYKTFGTPCDLVTRKTIILLEVCIYQVSPDWTEVRTTKSAPPTAAGPTLAQIPHVRIRNCSTQKTTETTLSGPSLSMDWSVLRRLTMKPVMLLPLLSPSWQRLRLLGNLSDLWMKIP